MSESVFSDTVTFAFVVHAELDSVDELKDALEGVDGVELVYQKKSLERLYIVEEKKGNPRRIQ